MRSFILGVAAAFTLAGAAGAASPGYANGPYTWDASDHCLDASGAAVSESLCPARPKRQTCHDPATGKPESCQANGALPDHTY